MKNTSVKIIHDRCHRNTRSSGAIAGGLLGGGFGVLVLFGLHWVIIGMALQLIALSWPVVGSDQ
ncbi:MAG: hypothetical protein HDT50_00260 [Lactobacillus sp.]|nr:hypothetical protein [Lactobacillus sp.]